MRSAQIFRIPQSVPTSQQVVYCLSIIEKHRAEVIPLRTQLSHCQQYHIPLIEQTKEWKEKYHKEKKEKEEWKESYEKAQQEITDLHKQIEKLTKTENRLNQALFAHGNFHQPQEQDKKPNGGQIGHKDTNQDTKRNTSSFQRQRIYAIQCGKCGNPLGRVTGIKEKTLIDIQITTKLIELVLQSERQWCQNCQQEVNARSAQTLPFTEYGINTFLMILLMRFRGNQSINNISENLFYGFGLRLSCSVILSILSQAKTFLQGKYDELAQAIRDGEVMYNDETGWLIKGDKAYMWIMASADKKDAEGNITKTGKTVYVASETRGIGIFEEMYGNSQAKSMHDGYSGYEGVTGIERCMYCWTHVVRFAFEETVKLESNHLACCIRDRLVGLYLDIREHPKRTREEKEAIMRTELDELIAINSDDETVKNIQHRIKTQKEGLILALLITEDGTNNLSEREFRKLVISRYISFGSASFEGMATTAVLSSILQTIHRDIQSPFLPTLREYLTTGIQKKYPQYKHPPSFAP